MMNFAHATPPPTVSASLRQTPNDFIVDETLAYELTGEGEHVYLYIRKRGLTTIAIAERLAKFANMRLRDIGYAGLKDKYAVTTQWFSLYLPQRPQIDWDAFNDDRVQILIVTQHQKKCRIGAVKQNTFAITLRDYAIPEDFSARLQQLQQQGMPNYFGEQRFGNHGDNLRKAEALLKGELTVKNHRLRGIYYSSARSWVFNQILSARVAAHNYFQAIPGDVMQHVGRRGYFSIENVDEEILQRVSTREIVPAGPLWGKGEHYVSGEAACYEKEALAQCENLCNGLVEHKVELAYRPFVVFPGELEAQQLAADVMKLTFTLPRGAFATSLLRELCRHPEPESNTRGAG